MELRKKGGFSDAAGDLYKEIEQINRLDEETCFMEENSTCTKMCDAFLTIICC